MRNDFETGYLEHSAKGTSWKNVKYIKKVPLGNDKFYYIYTQAELAAWNKRHSGEATNVLSNKETSQRKSAALSSTPKTLDNLVKSGMTAKGQTVEEKTENLKKNIADGEKKIQEALASSETKSKTKGSSGSSSKKSGSGSSSKKSGSGKSSSKGKSEKSSSSKEKSGSSSAAKSTKEKKTEEKKTRPENKGPVIDTIKKVFKKEDKDISSFKGSASDFKKNLLSKYKDGSFGYLVVGKKAYKWTIVGNDVVLRDYDTDNEVSFDKYLKNAKEFKEFQTNKKTK